MSYCPKCGNKVDETMTFCPNCGASLKMGTAGQAGPATTYPPYHHRHEKSDEKGNEKGRDEKYREKHEKAGGGYVFLIAGVVIVVLGLLAFINATSDFFHNLSGPVASALVLLVIGVLIVVAGIYYSARSRRRNPAPA